MEAKFHVGELVRIKWFDDIGTVNSMKCNGAGEWIYRVEFLDAETGFTGETWEPEPLLEMLLEENG